MNERKTYFSAVIERTTGMLNANPKIEKSGYYFKDIRTRNGDLIASYIIPTLAIEDQEKLLNCETGDYVAFIADVKLENIKLKMQLV